MQIEDSRPARRTGSDSRSASENATTNGRSRSLHARMMRSAISPRLAIRILPTISDHNHAAIDLEYLTGHIRSVVAGKKCDGAGHVLGRARATHRHLIEHPFEHV